MKAGLKYLEEKALQHPCRLAWNTNKYLEASLGRCASHNVPRGIAGPSLDFCQKALRRVVDSALKDFLDGPGRVLAPGTASVNNLRIASTTCERTEVMQVPILVIAIALSLGPLPENDHTDFSWEEIAVEPVALLKHVETCVALDSHAAT